MGLDQHRAQITGEWIDTETGEIQRTRIAPADRAWVRKFLSRFKGRELEVALEATTGWRFVVEELHHEQAAERIGGNRACLSVARRLLKRSYHTLRELGEEALQPA
jgi:hypothetical protein